MTENYSLDTMGAQSALNKSWHLMDHALSKLSARPSYEILNYGAADGGTSMDYFKKVFQRLDGALLHYTANDLPLNDFNTLARNLDVLRAEFENLSVFIQPSSFYFNVARKGSVDIALAATTMHWLSQVPCRAIGHLHANKVEGDIRDQFRTQALEDFDHLLALRAFEFRRGGHLIMVDLAEGMAGDFLGSNGTDLDMFDTLYSLWEELFNDKLITLETFEYALIQNYYKTGKEVQQVLSLPHQMENWKVHSLSTRTTPCPYRTQFDYDGDVDSFAEGLMKTIRSWSRHSFLEAVLKTGGNPSVVDHFFTRLQKRISQDPKRFSMDYTHNYIHLERL
ncbi:class I SAM-dependent methyltransferase [Flexibacterium corallicola]|uniref:hypothetical protein n=1 Tax=Flexibacterium corallicola TaxID=3037259 RepID=UPI00286F2BF0|nr:hypothetical protein [Pseudovibrio sp. M1P-2-3]